MSKKIILAIYTIIIVYCMTIQETKAQPWAFFPTTLGNNYIQTNWTNNEESAGIGDFNGNPPNIPLSALHINTNFFNTYVTPPSYPLGEVFRTDAPDNGIYSFWRMSTGTPSVEHLGIYNTDSWILNANYQYLDMNFRSSSGNMFFWTQGGHHNGLKRMMINSDIPQNLTINQVTTATAIDPGWSTSGYVGIGNNTIANGLPYGIWDVDQGGTGPRCLLHLEGPNNTGFSGNTWRSWMRTGTYVKENSDEMYIGMKNENHLNGPNRSDAVIAWGDDQALPDDPHADNFRIIFSGVSISGNGNGNFNPRDASGFSGMEVARITPHGRMGVGPLFTFSNGPARRLELLDYQAMTGASINEPQLRLTFTQANPAFINTTGIWTDIQTTNLGDLFIHPFRWTGAVQQNRFVGINTSAPINTLEINSSPFPLSPRPSGLRFTNLNSGSAIDIKPNGRVLTVDVNGHVVLTKGLANSCTIGNFLPKVDPANTDNLICSIAYDDGNNHLGIYTNVANPTQTLWCNRIKKIKS